MPDQNLKLNSLSRYTKQSPNLVLQEYGHCEVPSGCGGVVLRWRKPGEPVQMIVHLFAGNSETPRITLDGVEMGNHSRMPITIGEHVISLTLTQIRPARALFILASKLDPQDVRILGIREPIPLLSLADGSWKYTLEKPEEDGWEQPGFDDIHWKALVSKSFGRLSSPYGNLSYRTRSMKELGAVALGVDTGQTFLERLRTRQAQPDLLPVIYVRKLFCISRVEEDK